jgi:hypothetical protein
MRPCMQPRWKLRLQNAVEIVNVVTLRHKSVMNEEVIIRCTQQ